MSIKKAMATAMLLEKHKTETVEVLVEQISSTFSLLANIEPDAALQVLTAFNEQYSEEIRDELLDSRDKMIESVAGKIHIDLDDLD